MYEVMYQLPAAQALGYVVAGGSYKWRGDAIERSREVLRNSIPYTVVWIYDTETKTTMKEW